MDKGKEELWNWFSLSYASWLTLPRVLMHEMPDEWQGKMAELLNEFSETWDGSEMPVPHVSARHYNRFTKWPEWLLQYRHPNKDEINKIRVKQDN